MKTTARHFITSILLILACFCIDAGASSMPDDSEIFSSPDLERVTVHSTASAMFERAIDFFTKKIPDCFEQRLKNSLRYIDTIAEIFADKGIPYEIAYLPLIESRFSPLSVGPGGTVGLWQFMKGTAVRFGLIVDKYVDERRDPVKSTVAAAAYLSYLYDRFGSWDKALAAYNAGEGRVRKISDIYTSRKVPHITRKYVPSLMAAYVVAQDPERFGLSLNEERLTDQDEYIEITTSRSVSLKTLAVKYKTTVKALRDLNPALLSDKTPPYKYTIRVPNI